MRLLLVAVVAAGLVPAATPAAACAPAPGCVVDCLNEPPWIDTTDPVGTFKGLMPDCF